MVEILKNILTVLKDILSTSTKPYIHSLHYMSIYETNTIEVQGVAISCTNLGTSTCYVNNKPLKNGSYIEYSVTTPDVIKTKISIRFEGDGDNHLEIETLEKR